MGYSFGTEFIIKSYFVDDFAGLKKSAADRYVYCYSLTLAMT